MKYYSTELKKLFDTEDELNKAELAVSEETKKKELEKQEKEQAAKRVKDAFQKVADDKKAAREELKVFNKKYGTFYYNMKDDSWFDDPFVDFFKSFWIQ